MNSKGLSIFWRCFITYCICTLLFLGILIYSYTRVSREWQDSYTEQVLDSFSHNTQILSDDLFSVFYFPQAMGGSNYFFSVITSNEQSPKNSYYTSCVMENIEYQKGYFQLIDDVLIYMKKSGSVLTSKRQFRNISDCFEAYSYEQLNIPRILEDNELNKIGLTPFPADNISIKGASPQKYLTIMLNDTGGYCTYIFLLPIDRILEHFQLDTLPHDTFLSISDARGTTLFQSGNEIITPDEFITTEKQIPSIGGKASLSISKKFFTTVTRKAQQIVTIITILCALLGLFLCFVFSHYNTKPVHDMIEKANIPENKENRNELAVIYNYLSQTKKNQARLESRLLSNLIIKAFSGFPIAEKDLESIENASTIFSGPMHLAIIRCISSTGDPELHRLVLYQLQERPGADFIIEPVNREEIGMIFPGGETSLSALRKFLHEINTGLPEGCRIVCGVSAPFVGTERIPDAAQQAIFSIPDETELLVVFSDTPDPGQPKESVPDLKSFQSALFNWNKNEVIRLLDVFAESTRKELPGYAQQVFYSLLAFIRSAAEAIQIPSDLFKECTYARSISAEANIRALRKLIDYLFDQKAKLLLENKESSNREIIYYIDEHYGDPALSLGTLSSRFNRTERALNTLIVSETGQSFAQYLISVRMQNAAVYLRDTDMEVVEVAEKCGLALSTFYRNFKKIYGLTPADYKAGINHLQ